MGKIEVFNCEGLCQHEFCSSKYTHDILFKFFGVNYYVLLCEKHYEELLNKFLESEKDKICQ